MYTFYYNNWVILSNTNFDTHISKVGIPPLTRHHKVHHDISFPLQHDWLTQQWFGVDCPRSQGGTGGAGEWLRGGGGSG